MSLLRPGRGAPCGTRPETPDLLLTSGIIPAALLLLALFGFSSSAAVLLAELLLVARIAAVGIVVARLRTEPTSLSTVLAGIALALLALIIVVTKAVLTH